MIEWFIDAVSFLFMLSVLFSACLGQIARKHPKTTGTIFRGLLGFLIRK